MTSIFLEEHRTIIDHAPTMMWRATPDAQCDFVNDAWLEFTGLTLEEASGRGWVNCIHPDDRQAFLQAFEDQRDGFELEHRLRSADGKHRRVLSRARAYDDDEGRARGFVGSCLHFEHLSLSGAAAEDFFEMTLDNACVAGLDGYFRRVNPSWTRTLGWTADELTSRPIVDFVHPDDRDEVLAGRQRLKSGRKMGPLVNRYRHKDGSYRWFEWRSVAHVERGLVYAVARDVTEKKRSQQRLQEVEENRERLQRQLVFADRMASIGTLAAGIAHEINNPLAYVTGNIALILDEVADRGSSEGLDSLAELATEAQAGAERIRRIVRGLKTFSRAEEQRVETTEIRPLLETAINMAANEIRQRANLVKEYGTSPVIEADGARLGQVFINLLVNAAQAIPEGAASANEIRVVTSTDDQGRAIVEVRDTGEGIPDALIDRIFDPFFTTKPVGIGTGLGLSICHNIVTGLGGELTVESERGVGTTFRIALPPAAADPDDDHTDLADTDEGVGAAVLVIDDEPAIGRVLSRVLRDHEVTAVTSAKNALALLESGQQFDVILSDLMMPEMSGMSFFAEIEARFPELTDRVVFISGGAFTPKARAFLDRVTNETLEKPFAPPALRELVQRYVGSSAEDK